MHDSGAVMKRVNQFFIELGKEIFEVTLTLFKIMIPVIIVMKVVEEVGGIDLLSHCLSPLMSLVGLPSEMGIVWATTLLTLDLSNKRHTFAS